MLEPYDIWLFIGCAALLLALYSAIGSALVREIPYKAIIPVIVGVVCVIWAFSVADGAIGWVTPLETSVRIYGAIF